MSDQNKAQQRQLYLKKFRSVVGRCAAILLVIAVSAQLFSTGLVIFFEMATKVNGGELPIAVGIYNFLVSYFPCILADFVGIALGIVLLRPNFKRDSFVRPQSDRKFNFWGAFAGIGAGNIGASMFLMLQLLILMTGRQLTIPSIEIPMDSVLATVLCTVYTCLLGPVLEEIIFRGILLRSLQPFGAMTAIIISSVGFGMFHMNPVQMMLAVLVGLVLGYLTVRSKSILPAIVAHVVNNSLRILPTFFMSEDRVGLTFIFQLVAVGISALGAITLLVFIYKYGRGFTNLLHNEDISLAKTGHRLAHAAISPWSIVFILYYIGMMVYFMIRFVQ